MTINVGRSAYLYGHILRAESGAVGNGTNFETKTLNLAFSCVVERCGLTIDRVLAIARRRFSLRQ